MAIWQYDLSLIPVSSIDPDLDLPATVEDLKLKGQWDDAQLPVRFADRLANIVPEFASWDPDLRWWGSEEGDRIDVWEKDGRVTEVKDSD